MDWIVATPARGAEAVSFEARLSAEHLRMTDNILRSRNAYACEFYRSRFQAKLRKLFYLPPDAGRGSAVRRPVHASRRSRRPACPLWAKGGQTRVLRRYCVRGSK